MGYTHYFTQLRDITDSEWLSLMEAAEKLFKTATVPLGNFGGDPGSAPVITLDNIGFNGVGADSHETCYVARRRDARALGFCKTNRKPYDETVVAFLKLVDKTAPGSFELGSDGGDEIFR